MAKVLLVDDDANFVQATVELLDMLGHETESAASLEEARRSLGNTQIDLLILDLMLPDGSGLELLDSELADSAGEVAVITGNRGVKEAIQTMGGPRVRYLTKPLELERLKELVAGAQRDEAGPGSSDQALDRLMGESPAMIDLRRQVSKVAPMDVPVFLIGESGSGKELVADAIHGLSGRPGELVAVNCAAFNRELIASQLFGHEKGSFTGASKRHTGVFEQAGGGTLFLDEITEMPLDLQPTMLRVLETGRVTRVGGTEETPVDARVIAATNQDLDQSIADGAFREDLYFRLAVFPIKVPPLRERREDIETLAGHFLDHLNREYGTDYGLDEEFVELLNDHRWPGNVRELKHVVQRAYILADEDSGKLARPTLSSGAGGAGLRQDAVGISIREMEKDLILNTLDHFEGDKKRTAEVLGVSLKTLYNRLNDYAEEEDSS